MRASASEAALPETSFDLRSLVTEIGEWAEVESPTYHAAGVNRMMDLVGDALERLGATIERRSGQDGFGDLVKARFKGEVSEPGILVLAHVDTVHPVGTLAGPLAVREEGDRLYGPGACDMKGGVCLVRAAMAAIVDAGELTPLPVTIMLVPDEEVGSPTSRHEIEYEARQHRFVLVAEPSADGDLVTGRWAIQRFMLHTRGRPAHAGVPGAGGRSAIAEMAVQILNVEALAEPSRRTTVSVGKVHAGMFVNVVPAECNAEVLTVAVDPTGAAGIRERILGLESADPEVELEVVAGPVRPLSQPNGGTLSLYEHAREIARAMDFDPGHRSAGGGSDGNFTGALGIPTLDGLGVRGGGVHTLGEFAEVSSFVPRARLLSGLLRSLS
jgi:glutamate carboxypeptidase